MPPNTDPTGRSFISYRRRRAEEVAALVAAHRDHGIPTWLDLDDLPPGPTEDGLRRALADPLTANGVMWITPEVAESAVITRVEAPLLVGRIDAGDSFFLVPVAAGGLDYDGAAEVVAEYLPAHSLEAWNILKAEGGSSDDAARVARRVLTSRLMAVHDSLPPGDPLQITFDARGPAAFRPGTALAFDWSHRFTDRVAAPPVWSDLLLPAVRTAAEAIRVRAPGRGVVARGLTPVPAAVALGEAFLAIREVPLTWMQYTHGRGEQPWSLSVAAEPTVLEASTRAVATGASDLAVLVSVTDDCRTAFNATRNNLPAFRAVIDVHAPDYRFVDLETPGQATGAARLVVDSIRRARHDYQPISTIHLFMAIPPGLAVLIGQLLNTLGPVQTYEYIAPDMASGRYRPGALLDPTR